MMFLFVLCFFLALDIVAVLILYIDLYFAFVETVLLLFKGEQPLDQLFNFLFVLSKGFRTSRANAVKDYIFSGQYDWLLMYLRRMFILMMLLALCGCPILRDSGISVLFVYCDWLGIVFLSLPWSLRRVSVYGNLLSMRS